MRTGTSRSLSTAFILIAVAPVAAGATGLFDDPTSLFPPIDTARTVLAVSEAAIDLDGGEATLASFAARLRAGSRTRISLSTQFPAVRTPGDISYGIGDLFVSAAVRLAGDTLETSGFFVGVACRAPTGSRSLAPLSHASLDGSIGCEARGGVSIFAIRALARYTLAGERTEDEEFFHDHHASLAGAFALDIPRAGSATVSAVWTRYNCGAARRSLCVSFSIDLSDAIAISAALAAEGGDALAASYDRFAGLSLSYRFSPRSVPVSGESQAP